MSDGHVGKCKSCNKQDVKKNYKDNVEYYRAYEKKRFKDPKRKLMVLRYAKQRAEAFPGKEEARRKIRYAIRTKKIIRPIVCEKCKEKKKIQAHHIDYRRPLFVKWLCFQCHRQEHGQNPSN